MKKPKSSGRIGSSFRDPSGFLFHREGLIYRQVNTVYRDDYARLMKSGLYETLVDAELLVPHEEVDIPCREPNEGLRVLKPALVPFVSYPYEWCFSQLKDAALTTLEIQKTALDFGMSLKDSSAYNVQFPKGKPILIDTLSFERYREGEPWIAYRQFCQHFLAPLALMSYRDIRLNQLFRVHVDGIPLDLASSLLPFRTRLIFPLLSHIHLHARSQRRFADKSVKKDDRRMGQLSFLGLIDSLESGVRRLEWEPEGTEWGDYYESTNYSTEALQHKKQIVAKFVTHGSPVSVWDLGANVGMFSRLASDRGVHTVSFDADPAAVERNYLECITRGEANILPLVLDLTNPSPRIGWQNQERLSWMERGPADTVLALALLHHLAISNNVPLDMIADLFHQACRKSLVVEFVPKSDGQVQKLLSSREDIFPDYTQQAFERALKRHFTVTDRVSIKDSSRLVYLMERRQQQR